ncbi:sensor histidine kinase [Loktanella sp. SALINAS62]|uniref:sensor histidine kinase n=1 Tax=Loktanella sp. SALINAS62 TaxID=2706124 RepID=UPI001B8C2D53|nr:sensor histidine kinase [Loktanella sp. SALINAS62]MBS1302600.1 sensor histidine kinase [Loktanella sp. SALINAS62]
MTKSQSIGRRLTLLLAAVAAVLSVLSWAMVTVLAREATQRTQDNVLAASVTTIAETLRSEQAEVRLELPYAAFAMLGAISQDLVFYRVTANDRTLTGYDDLPSFETGRQGQVMFHTANYRSVPIRMAATTRLISVGDGQTQVTVTVAQTRDGVGAIAADLSQLAAFFSLAFFAVAVGLSAVVAATSLRPLNEIAAAVSRRGPSDLRPVQRNAPAELAPLLTALNRLMDRLRNSIRRSEDFITEAAHRIRTPLATVRAQAEIALRTVQGDTEKDRLRQIIRAVDESSRSAGQLLDHATVAYRTENLTQDRLDLSELAADTLAAMEPTASMRDIRLRLDGEQAPVIGDPILLESAIRNVLDNAIKYSAEDTTVTLHITCSDSETHLTICDEGPGFGDESFDTLTERFRRGPNTGGIVGSGLGLTIVAEVMAAHGGRIELTTSTHNERGGACVCFTLPSA